MAVGDDKSRNRKAAVVHILSNMQEFFWDEGARKYAMAFRMINPVSANYVGDRLGFNGWFIEAVGVHLRTNPTHSK